jgi:hypothetical protein
MLFAGTSNKAENFVSLPGLPMRDFKIENGEIGYMYFTNGVLNDVVGHKFLYNFSYPENIKQDSPH